MKAIERLGFCVKINGRNGESWLFITDDKIESLNVLEDELFNLVIQGVTTAENAAEAMDVIDDCIEVSDG